MTTFTYHGKINDELTEHSGQACEIVRELDDSMRSHEVGPMFHVRFPDGYEAHTFAWELDPEPKSTTLRWVGVDHRWEAV